ncbi:Uncharacterised protein [Mycobacterium tuberculosis]|nr:Uncharacterised protein [Mycobacterium tuberculosis]
MMSIITKTRDLFTKVPITTILMAKKSNLSHNQNIMPTSTLTKITLRAALKN